MKNYGRKNKRGDSGSVEEEDEEEEEEAQSDAKRPNMAEDGNAAEPSLAELKEMLSDIQVKVTNIQLKNLNFKEELIDPKASINSQNRAAREEHEDCNGSSCARKSKAEARTAIDKEETKERN